MRSLWRFMRNKESHVETLIVWTHGAGSALAALIAFQGSGWFTAGWLFVASMLFTAAVWQSAWFHEKHVDNEYKMEL